MVTGRQLEQAKAVILEAAKTRSGPSLSEKDLLRLVINFVNGGELAGPLLFSPGIRFIRPIGAGVDYVPGFSDLTPDSAQWVGNVRQNLREDMAAAVGAGIPAKRFQELLTLAADMVATPRYELEQGRSRRLRVRWHYEPLHLESILAYAVLLLRDEERGFGADLKRCRLPSCGVFFFSSDRSQQTGKPRELYCTTEHMLEAHKATSTERVRRWRAKHK